MGGLTTKGTGYREGGRVDYGGYRRRWEGRLRRVQKAVGGLTTEGTGCGERVV